MTGGAQSCRNDKPSINYRYNPHGGAFLDHVDDTPEDYALSSRDNRTQPAKHSEAKSSGILSMADLISGVGQLWNFANSSLPILHHRTTSEQKNDSLQKANTFYYPAEEGNIIAIYSEGQNVSVNLKADSHVSTAVNLQKELDSLHVTKKLSPLDCCSLLRCTRTASYKTIQPCKENRFSGGTILYELRNIYGWMSELSRPRCEVTEHDKERIDSCGNVGETRAERTITNYATRHDSDIITRSDVCHAELAETRESSLGGNANNVLKPSAGVMSLCSDYLLHPIQDVEADGCGSIVPTSSLQTDSYLQFLGSGTSSYLEPQYTKEDDLHEAKDDQEREFVNQEKSDMDIFSSTSYKPLYGLAKQEHAFAGAFAGIFVSLCLHPMDTIKTVVQSCRTDQRSIPYIGKSIISERGLSGLYRGIASNITSSAPISAIYTFTYESVKGALLPRVAKEYHPLIHCMAGGCASVATSFVFTPSERIKQQMQVGSHYHSCWDALFGIVGKGGFSSLYNGWGAVLCRNVPHSIIKFYTYESLKNIMFSPRESHAQPTTILTILCGGLAGSTAALFTTPFDVVKTRLQTQIPGSVNHYHGVFKTLKDIGEHEGLRGLYRGLTPRLAMYMTQGALFFASYESFKTLFSLEATRLESSSKGS